jgi:hypothetical protein
MRKKRLADWLEKMSAAFMVGAVLADKGFMVCVGLGVASFLMAMYLTDKEGKA